MSDEKSMEKKLKMNDKIKRGMIIWAKNDRAHGNVQNKKRPYVVVSNDYCNHSSNILTAIPLTTAYKTNLPTHFCWTDDDGIHQTALCEQITCLDKKDVISISKTSVTKNEMRSIENCILIQLDLEGTWKI